MNPYNEIIEIIDRRSRRTSHFAVGTVGINPLTVTVMGETFSDITVAKGALGETALAGGENCLLYLEERPVIVAFW